TQHLVTAAGQRRNTRPAGLSYRGRATAEESWRASGPSANFRRHSLTVTAGVPFERSGWILGTTAIPWSMVVEPRLGTDARHDRKGLSGLGTALGGRHERRVARAPRRTRPA